MVKSPRIQHSKTSTEPVTIDLSADEVSRVPGESPVKPAASADKGASASVQEKPAGGSGSAAKDKTAEAEAPKPAAAGGASAAGKPAMREAPNQQTPSRETPNQATSKTESPGAKSATGSATASAFGRDASSRPSSPPPPPPASRPSGAETPPRRGAGSVIAAGLIGGVIVLAGVGGAWYGGLLPPANFVGNPPAATDSGQTDALRAELESLRAEIAELRNQPPAAGDADAGLTDANARIESVSVLVEEMRAELARLQESFAAGDSQGQAEGLEPLRAALAALEQRVAALPAEGAGADTEALRTEITQVEESVRSAVESASSAAAAATATGSRIEELQKSLADLTARVEEQDKTPGVALAIAASALKAAIDRGTPFMTELETYAGLAPEAPEVAALRDMAAAGVPTRAAIAAETDAAAIRMIDAGRVIDPNSGVLDRLWASAQSVIKVRPIGDVEGEGVPAIVARMEAALDAGDYDRAIAEYQTLPADAKAAGETFMDKVVARHTADQLIDQTLAAALRA